jgi:hypothetical protein
MGQIFVAFSEYLNFERLVFRPLCRMHEAKAEAMRARDGLLPRPPTAAAH